MYRIVTLIGALEGPIWWPVGSTCQLRIDVDLTAGLARDVSRSGMIGAIRSYVTSAGDFSACPKLTGDSLVVIQHVFQPRLNERLAHAKVVEVRQLPSLADLVSRDALMVPA
jgi:hypothetical protein